MSRKGTAALVVLLGVAALTSCSSDNSEGNADKPVTKQLSQGEITQALPGTGDVISGWEPYKDKRVTKEASYCTASGSTAEPEGWVRGGSAWFVYNGSTNNMMDVSVCLYDTVAHSKAAYAAWRGKEADKEQGLDKPVGEESVLVTNPGHSDDSLSAFSRSGNVNIRVKINGTAGDSTGAQDVLAATLKRLQQVQDGERATATAAEQTKQ
ncbi:hypothetical protein [Streptomyces mutabilis]|uniref:Lipoprotein n=1 Tax=Streptomyces mutabilis TaxID=67332 RepID=A0A086MR18_9ACTN|nr:hypothetical protein [Streptomyces mutabilis]KFG71336.1 hypothetical protein FM21_34070 [Streptomyces mutabilis]